MALLDRLPFVKARALLGGSLTYHCRRDLGLIYLNTGSCSWQELLSHHVHTK